MDREDELIVVLKGIKTELAIISFCVLFVTFLSFCWLLVSMIKQ